ncbi:hypothetical protein [Qipengyuania sp. RANM35]|uniref:hypothetical protein n=1 Tax=Qipengyuania sp. RANM35 TaxID=3068635 RepID=UPI0034DACF67
MKTRFRLPLTALAVTLSAPVMAQQAEDFSLPPAPAPSATQRAQGPVDTESGALPLRPRVISTAAPAPTPTPTPAAATPQQSRVERPVPTTAAPRQTAPQQSRQAPANPQPTPIERQPVVPQEFPAAPSARPTQPSTAPSPSIDTGIVPAPVTQDASEALPFDWRLLAGVGGALVLLLGGFLFWRRRKAAELPPEIERPVVASAAPRAAIPAAQALSIRCEAEKLTRSAVYATLKYRLTLVNRTDAAMTDVAIGIDLVSAHAAAPMEEQVATLATPLETRHTLPRIAPRQNVSVEGQVQLPLASAQVIFQGQHPLLVPLMRVRIDGAGEGVLLKTFVVGQGEPDGGRVQPFRLDEAPRSYSPIAQRELA